VGIDESFTTFVDGARRDLVRFGFLLVGDQHRAEDLVQVALLKVFVRWRRVDDPAAYTRTVMIREASRWRRRRWTGERPDIAAGAESGTADPSEAIDAAEAVRHALLLLPVDQRAVLVLRYFEQRSEAEIASLLGIAPGTVKSRAARALETLRQTGCLDEDSNLRRTPNGR
jgi:RNA polymerase sigma-70 factor (sigma-E family)